MLNVMEVSMAKKFGYIQWGLFFLGFALGYVGWRFGQPIWISIGAAIAGLGIAAGGVEDMITRRVNLVYGEDNYRSQTYRGLSAVLFGVMWILVGIALFVGGLTYTIGLSELVWGFVQARPGPILILTGLAMMAYGGVEVLGAREDSPTASFWRFLGSVPARIFALILVFVGLVTLTAGALELVAPDSFDAMVIWLSNIFSPRIPEY
jgi:hypothetical protein